MYWATLMWTQLCLSPDPVLTSIPQLPPEGSGYPCSSLSELRAHSYHNYPAHGQERAKPSSCKCTPRGDLDVLICVFIIL